MASLVRRAAEKRVVLKPMLQLPAIASQQDSLELRFRPMDSQTRRKSRTMQEAPPIPALTYWKNLLPLVQVFLRALPG